MPCYIAFTQKLVYAATLNALVRGTYVITLDSTGVVKSFYFISYPLGATIAVTILGL